MSGFSLTLPAPEEGCDELIAELWDAGTTGIREESSWVRASFDETADSAALMRRFATYHPCLERDDDHDWVAHAQSMWDAFPVGERFFLVPEWRGDPAPCGRIRLRMRPGLACGSGWHPATQLCLQAMERVNVGAASLLDVGTGSGILAEAAELLGARPVFACDIDHEATVVARGNLAGCAVRPFLYTGSLRSVRDRAVDHIVANLNAITIASVATDLVRVARRNIVISGFREHESAEVAGLFQADALHHLKQDDWACLIF